MQTDNVKVSIEATDGRPMRHYGHEGKTYLESHENREYQVRIKNQLGRCIKVVVSVDSLNIISGKPASDDPSETGYILNPYEEQVLKGYRVDNDTVAAFKFVKREASYATETGSGAGNGVISVRAYEEKETEEEKTKKKLKKLQEQFDEWTKRVPEKEYVPYPVYPSRPWYWEWDYYPYWRPNRVLYGGGSTTDGMYHGTTTLGLSSQMGGTSIGTNLGANLHATAFNAGSNLNGIAGSNNMVKCAAPAMDVLCSAQAVAEPQPFDMGSGWGDSIKDAVREIEFVSGALVAEITIYYASLAGLKALGVNVERIKAVAFPEPFKREFCARPSGWKG